MTKSDYAVRKYYRSLADKYIAKDGAAPEEEKPTIQATELAGPLGALVRLYGEEFVINAATERMKAIASAFREPSFGRVGAAGPHFVIPPRPFLPVPVTPKMEMLGLKISAKDATSLIDGTKIDALWMDESPTLPPTESEAREEYEKSSWTSFLPDEPPLTTASGRPVRMETDEDKRALQRALDEAGVTGAMSPEDAIEALKRAGVPIGTITLTPIETADEMKKYFREYLEAIQAQLADVASLDRLSAKPHFVDGPCSIEEASFLVRRLMADSSTTAGVLEALILAISIIAADCPAPGYSDPHSYATSILHRVKALAQR